MEKQHKLSNGDTFVVNDEITSRFDRLGLSEEARNEILQEMAQTAEEWAALEAPQHSRTIPERLSSMASRAVSRLAHR
jgi:hypothetical protein